MPHIIFYISRYKMAVNIFMKMCLVRELAQYFISPL